MSASVKKKLRRRNYSEAFKREAVSTYETSSKSYAEISRLLDISCGSLLKQWCVLYGSNKKALKKEAPMTSDDISPLSLHSPEKSVDKERISALEVEVKQLRQALGNQAAKKVDQLVSKKL